MTLEIFGHIMAVAVFIDWCILTGRQRSDLKKIDEIAGRFKDDLNTVFNIYNERLGQKQKEFDALIEENRVLREMLSESQNDVLFMANKLKPKGPIHP